MRGWTALRIDLPALNVKPTHGEYVPMNIEVRDPLWPMRDMMTLPSRVKPGEPHTLWLDTRDRILPNDKSILITIASASPEFNAGSLEGASGAADLQAVQGRGSGACGRPAGAGAGQLLQHDGRARQFEAPEYVQPLLCGHYRSVARRSAERSGTEVLARMESGDGAAGLHAAQDSGGCAGMGVPAGEGRGLLPAHRATSTSTSGRRGMASSAAGWATTATLPICFRRWR